MVSETNLLNKLATLVAGFDDSAWEALASKGLLRRARKDLERGLKVEIVEETANTLKLTVESLIVSVPESGPAGADCSCPAAGICQHILAVGLYLQSHSPGVSERKVGPTEESVRSEIAVLTPDRLKSLVGAADYRSGVAFFEKNTLPPQIEYSETVVIRLLPSGVEVRFVPGGGLEGMIVPKSQGRRVAVAALLALRKHLGLEIPASAAQQSLVEITGTPRSKKELLDSACSVLEDAVSVGLSHASEVLVDRLVTLAVSAQGAQLPRVALALKTVADEVGSILRREARADESRLLVVIARVYALMDAIRSGGDNQPIELTGAARGQYVEVPEIELAGVGAYPWATGSGYVGLTVLFWSAATSEFLSWSYARPEIQRADARQRFYNEGPWDGVQSPQQAARSHLKLRGARRTANGRLSGSMKTSALVLSAVVPSSLDFGNRLFSSWALLGHYVSANQPLGLRDPNPLGMIAVLQPRAFGTRSFDPITQTFSWDVYDVMAQPLTLSLPFRDWTRQSIRILEELSPPSDFSWKFVVRLAGDGANFSVEPISILRPENAEHPVFQLAFDSLPRGTAVATENETTASDDEVLTMAADESVGMTEAGAPVRGSLYRVLSELNRRLEAIAETGLQNGLANQRAWVASSHQEVHGFGLTVLARSLATLSGQSATPAALLRTRYLTHLHGQAVSHLS